MSNSLATRKKVHMAGLSRRGSFGNASTTHLYVSCRNKNATVALRHAIQPHTMLSSMHKVLTWKHAIPTAITPIHLKASGTERTAGVKKIAWACNQEIGSYSCQSCSVSMWDSRIYIILCHLTPTPDLAGAWPTDEWRRKARHRAPNLERKCFQMMHQIFRSDFIAVNMLNCHKILYCMDTMIPTTRTHTAISIFTWTLWHTTRTKIYIGGPAG